MILKRHVYKEEDPKSIWLQYYADIIPPTKVITGENQNITATENKCFAYICNYINIQDRAVNFINTKDYSILLCENSFSKGPGTVCISSLSKNDIIIDKFCSFESISPSGGHFTHYSSNINSAILRGSISNGGSISTERGMVYQFQGFATLSNTNMTNCNSMYSAAFYYWFVESIPKISFCNFENLESNQTISQFEGSNGRIERSNYINNSQKDIIWGIILESGRRLDIIDLIFRNNRKNQKGYLLHANKGEIYIYRCDIDDQSFFDTVFTSEMTTESFSNDIKFIGLSPCQGELQIFRIREKKICSLCICNYFFFVKYFLSFWLIS